MKVSKCLNTDVSPQHQLSLAVCLDALHVLLQLKPVTTITPITPTVMLNIVLAPTDSLKAKAVLKQVLATPSALVDHVMVPTTNRNV